jgi:transposase
MPKGRHTRYVITLTLPERRHLEGLLRETVTRQDVTRRARIILLLADGETITDIAHRADMSRKHVYKWIARYLRIGRACLWDTPGRWRASREGESHA